MNKIEGITMNQIKVELLRYKWLWVIGVIIAIVMGIVAANFHVIQFAYARMQGDTKSIIKLLERDVKNQERQSNWHFKEGIKVLLEDGSQESLEFLEEHLGKMTLERKFDIIKGYNKKSLLFEKQTIFMQLLMQDLENEVLRTYVKRMDAAVLDQELFYYFGDKPDLTDHFINTLYEILMIYPKQLPLDKFQFKLYPILTLDSEGSDVKKNQIFSKIDATVAKNLLFKELKTVPVEISEFSVWIEILNKNKVLTSQEYASFTKIYREFQIAHTQYMGLGQKEVDLRNKKQTIEIELGDKLKLLENGLLSINGLKYDITALEKELEKLTDYAHMAFYIDKFYGNDEYEASVPRKSFLGNYVASSQKNILKLNTTNFYKEGVYYVDVYLSGTKIGDKGKEYPYYTEASKENLERINTLSRSREKQLQELQIITKDIADLKNAIDIIKKDTGYEENEANIANLDQEKDSLIRSLDEKIIQVKNLFEMGNITRK